MRSIDRAGLAYLDKAWRAVTASNPAALMEFIDQVPSPFPLLRTAFERVLWRYPDIRSGLNRYEARLLSSTRDEGPTAAKVIASTMKAFFDEENECVGDNWLFGRLRGLADPARPHPAVALTGERTTIWGTEAHLTPEGERFLKGELNFVELMGSTTGLAECISTREPEMFGSIKIGRLFAVSRGINVAEHRNASLITWHGPMGAGECRILKRVIRYRGFPVPT